MLLSDTFRYFPSYFLDNIPRLSKAGAAVEPYPEEYEPDIVLGASYIFCKLCDTPKFKNELITTPLCNRIMGTLEGVNIDSESTKRHILEMTPYFTSVLLQAKTSQEIEKHLKSYLGDNNITIILTSTLIELKVALADIWGDLKTRGRFLWDVCEFYFTITRVVVEEEERQCLYPIAYPLPSYLPKTVENRLLLLGLLPRKQEIKSNLDKLTPKFNNCTSKFLSSSLDKFVISPSYFKRLIMSLPKKKLDPKIRHFTVIPFENYIWKGHAYAFPKFKGMEESYLKKQPNLFIQFEDWQLLAQIICLLQPNWQRLWYLCGWPAPLGVVRRLAFFKNEEKWSPPTAAMVEILAKP